MTDRWFSGPRWRAKKSESKKLEGPTLFVLHFRLFCKRDKNNEIITGDFSESMLQQASKKFALVVIFFYGSHREEVQALLELAKKFPNVELEEITDTLDAAEKLKRRIINGGGRIKHVKNPREITSLNINRFVIDNDGSFQFATSPNAEEIGIEVEKPQNFQDMNKKRQGRSFW